MARTLRPYQRDALAGIRAALGDHPSTVGVLPTGTGKMTIAAALMTEWPGGNVLFLAHTRELVDQAADRLAAELGYRPVVEMGDRRGVIDRLYGGGLIVVGSVQSMATDRRLKKYERHPFDLIVIDEAHRAVAAGYRTVVDFFTALNPGCKVVGFTATPNRADGKALGLAFGSVGYSMEIADAVDNGWLVPVRQRAVVVSEVAISGPARTDQFGERDFSNAAVEQVMADEEALHRTAVPLVKEAGGRPTLVFAATVRHAHELAAVIDRYAPGAAAPVDGQTPPAERQALIDLFAAGRLQFLVNCQLFTEGFDAPNCACVAIARPTRSVGRYTQMVGRGLRPLAGVVDGLPDDPMERKLAILTSDKPDGLVLDFVGAGVNGLATVEDVLGGGYDAETRALAAADRARGGDTKVGESLRRAQFLLALERQMQARAGQRAEVGYRTFDRDGRTVAAPAVAPPKRGSLTDRQLGLLIVLGVDPATAVRYSARQAAAVIDSLKATRCTPKQRAVLVRAGVDPSGIGVDRAGRIIDALKANNWRRPEVLPA